MDYNFTASLSCPWTNKESEWNIDSISSLSVPYPVISVSRKNFLNSHQQEMEFKLLRQEEVGHTHPSFIEIYFCIKGQLQLEININKTVKKICLDESNILVILVILPNIPHHIANVKFIDNRYAHTCIQLLSKFHYPFHSTKRNYEFSSIDIHRSN